MTAQFSKLWTLESKQKMQQEIMNLQLHILTNSYSHLHYAYCDEHKKSLMVEQKPTKEKLRHNFAIKAGYSNPLYGVFVIFLTFSSKFSII